MDERVSQIVKELK
jgi:hypothetical protein